MHQKKKSPEFNQWKTTRLSHCKEPLVREEALARIQPMRLGKGFLEKFEGGVGMGRNQFKWRMRRHVHVSKSIYVKSIQKKKSEGMWKVKKESVWIFKPISFSIHMLS